jgi:diguanylate cyclase
LLDFIVNRVGVGIFVVDESMTVKLWNKFMVTHSGKEETEVVGYHLFTLFPDLPEKWLRKKLDAVLKLGSFSFISWEQRPFLFQFRHNRPITGGIEFMCQDITMIPIKNAEGVITAVCCSIHDVTDVSLLKRQLQEKNTELEAFSKVDALSRLYNRGYWQQRLVEERSRFVRYGTHFSLLMMDIDFFKKVNDTYGHLWGDAVIVHVAKVIKSALRDNDIAGRYGGEEFAVLLPLTHIDGAIIVAERIRRLIESTPIPYEDGKTLSITVSVGVAECLTSMKSPEELLACADHALYESKHGGRNRCTRYEKKAIES